MESNQINLSIVIPAHNEELRIGKCLLSVIAETDKSPYKTEVIVVNNASTDNTAKIALSFPGVKVFDEPKKGTNQARQRGFVESHGELIANIDADNMLPEGWLNAAFKNFEKTPKLAALSGPYIYFDLSPFMRLVFKLVYRLGYPVYVINNRIFKSGGAVMGGNLVIRRSALEKIGGYNTDLTFYGDDTDTAVRLSKIGIVKFDYKFKIYSSGRRLKKEGATGAVFRYSINHIWVSLFGRPFHHDFRKIK